MKRHKIKPINEDNDVKLKGFLNTLFLNLRKNDKKEFTVKTIINSFAYYIKDVIIPC